MKIYTKTGDDGTTGLIGGVRVSKADIRVEAYGTVDEANSWLGLIRAVCNYEEINQELICIQRNLFTICAHLASDYKRVPQSAPAIPVLDPEFSKFLEKSIDKYNESIPALENFIIPGGSQLSASCHLARAVCRRAERRVTALAGTAKVDAEILVFLNRLSDYLFVLARYFSFKQHVDEIFLKNDL